MALTRSQGACVPITVKTKLNLKQLPKDISKRFSVELKKDFADEIVKTILEGKSPVKGKRFKKYSDGYAKKKGRSAPVDMNDTGRMLDSIRVKQDSKGRVEIFFKDIVALYHNTMGAGRGKVIRRLLPTKRGETFGPKLMKQLNKILKKAVVKSVAKQNK